ncbi:MAG TPA: DNA mismatch repair protein MutS, partial [Candidatus Dojkabacteria bacterium]
MQRQYNELKNEYKDSILLFRLGDFYEGFDRDAEKLAKILGITLTGRGKGEKRIPMAGIPYHALDQYLPKLIAAGEKIAIAEQVEEPQAGKIVERKVTKVITPGTITDEKSLKASKNNYLMCLAKQSDRKKTIWGASLTDLTTGEFKVFEVSQNSNIEKIPREIVDFVFKKLPNEILIPDNYSRLIKSAFSGFQITQYEDEYSTLPKARNVLSEQFKVKNFKGFGIDEMTSGLIAASEIISYLRETQKRSIDHFNKIQKEELSEFMQLDEATVRNLELLENANSSNSLNSLFNILNECQTPMGQRLLGSWIVSPLLSKEKLEMRLHAVDELLNSSSKLNLLRHELSQIYDMERIIGKIGLGSVNGRDLKALESSLQKILNLESIELKPSSIILKNLFKKVNNFSEISYIIDLVRNAVQEDPPVTITEGRIFNDGFDKELDRLRTISRNGKDLIKDMQAREVQETGITSLKIKFNSVFGYYIEISKSNLGKVPETYVRKQTLVNAERYITEDLKKFEEEILGAEEKIIKLEYELFTKLRNDIAQFIPSLQEISKMISILDVLSNFAHLAKYHNYARPVIADNKIFRIKGSRHVVVERITEDAFITNDLEFDKNKNLMILTGPNMSGKSTFIRQIALISLLAQIGCFVPAKSAELPIVDRIFTRVGASDNLSKGESTFMVEMNETANILNNATDNSLIILDEVGRGTSTYDGIALAWSITEFIHEKIGAATLFATHYHELTEMEKQYKRIVNFQVEVLEEKGAVTFLRKIKKGGADKSYGIHVAKLAGVPENVTSRAAEILRKLEDSRQSSSK